MKNKKVKDILENKDFNAQCKDAVPVVRRWIARLDRHDTGCFMRNAMRELLRHYCFFLAYEAYYTRKDDLRT